MNFQIIKDRWGETRRALLLVWESSPKWAVYNGLLLVLRGVMPLLFIYLIKLLIDISTALIRSGAKDKNFSDLIYVLCAAGLVFLINSLTSSFGSYLRERHSYYVNDHIKAKIHKRTSVMNYSHFEDFHFQDIHHRAVSESSYRPSRIFFGLIALFQNLITLGVVTLIFISLHWAATLLLLLVSVPIVYIRLYSARELYKLRRKQTADERRVNYYDTLLTDKMFAKEVRLFNLGDLFQDRYRETITSLRSKQLNTIWIATKNETVIQVFTAFAFFGLYGLIAWLAFQGKITEGSMVMYFLVLQRGHSVLQDFLGRIATLYEDSLYLKDLFEFFDYEISVDCNERTKLFPSPISQGIVMENVSFKYNHSSRKVFKNFNLHIKPCETLAIVGANGCGKTTLIKLLCGLYEPTAGAISVDGVNLNQIKKESISTSVSAIFQDFTLYNVSAKENIWFGDVSKEQNINEIRMAGKMAGVDKLLSSLPNGYDTTIGNLFEGSEMLSQGEWQRIALARSIYHNSDLIILDEPTSSLDAFTESLLLAHFKEITMARTAVIISHRLTTIKIADRILALGGDDTYEIGTHDELMERQGIYFSMVSALSQD